MRSPRPILVVALLLSIFMHLFLVDRAVDLTMKWDLFSTTAADEFFRIQDVDVHRMPRERPAEPVEPPKDLMTFEAPGEKPIVETEAEDKDVLLETEKFIPSDVPEEKLLETIEQAITAEDIAKTGETPTAPVAEEIIAQEVIAMDENLLKDVEIPPSRPRISKERRGTAKTDFLFPGMGPAVPAPGAITKGPPGELISPGSPAERQTLAKAITAEKTRAIPGVIASPPSIIESEIERAELVDIVTEEYEGIRQYPSLDDLLTVRLFTYHRSGERKGYFELSVEPKRDRKDIPLLPKDIFFLVDTSMSITQEILSLYVEGIKLCLRDLRPQDRFNMVEFKVFIRKFSEEEDLVAATPEAIRKAEEWLSQLVSEGATDLYKSLTELVKLPPTPGRPRIIFLVSDGRPQAQIWEDSEIINQVTQINQLRASVFTFGAGRKINTSLLDLLSYRNRGLRMFETDDKKIAQSLFDFYRSFSSPILMNPRFNFGSLDSTEVYPKALPDLYLHSRLQLFGRFEGEGEFSMQLLGEAEGQTKEYVLQQKLARKDNADATVAQQWAFRKIYHLVGRIVQEGESQAIRSEIERLSAGYSVRTPYSRGAAAGSAGGGR